MDFDESYLNSTIDARDDYEANTEKSGGGTYLYNNSNSILLNGTELNATIDARDDVGSGSGGFDGANGLYIYNNSGNVTFNTTEASESLSVNQSDYWNGFDTASDLNNQITLDSDNITNENWIEDSQESNLDVNSSDYLRASEGNVDDVSDIDGSDINNDLNWINSSEVNGSKWNVSSNNIYPEDTSYNVGVGTDSPSKTLEVAGTFNVSGSSKFGQPSDFGNNYINFSNAGIDYSLGGGSTPDASSSGIHLEANTNPTIGDQAIFTVESSGGAERLKVEHDGELFTTNDLNVSGSGVSSFVGKVTSQTNFCIENGQCLAGLDGGRWNVSGSQLYPQDLNYDTGIGTDSPSDKFEVNGSIALTNDSNAYRIGGTDVLRVNFSQDSIAIGDTNASLTNSILNGRVTAIGKEAGQGAGNGDGYRYAAQGYQAGKNAGDSFTATGYQAGKNAGSQFVAKGYQAGIGSGNTFTAIGNNAGGGKDNFVAIGNEAGITSGNRFVSIGAHSGTDSPSDINNTIGIGYQSSPQYSGHFVFQNNKSEAPIIQGNFNTGKVGINYGNGIELNNSLGVKGSVGYESKLKDGCSNFNAEDSYAYYVNMSGCSSKTASLPQISNAENRIYVFKKVDSTSGSLTISPATGDTIDGAPQVSLDDQNERIMIQAVPETGRWEVIQYSGSQSFGT